MSNENSTKNPAEKQAEVRAFKALKQQNALLLEQNEALNKENEQLKEAVETLKNATPDYEQIASSPDFIEEYALGSALLKAKIIEDYLRSLSKGGGVSVLSTTVGAPPLTPHKKPKSLAEAKKLAEIIING